MKKIVVNLVIAITIEFLIAYFLCDIKPFTQYGWLSGLWHGVFFIQNLILHLIDHDILYFADLHSTSYTIFFIIGVGLNSLYKDISGIHLEKEAEKDD